MAHLRPVGSSIAACAWAGFIVMFGPDVAGAQAPQGVATPSATAPAAQPPTGLAAPTPRVPAPPPTTAAPGAVAGVAVPAGYVIGADDLLGIIFWRDKEMTADVTVRPDGNITLPLVNEIHAAGLTPEQLRDRITHAAAQFVEDPTVSVVVRQINSRKVFITGLVGKGGAYPLTAPTTVLQLLSMAGGVSEFAKSNQIMIMRTENGRQRALRFNFKDVKRGRNLQQNIELQPGDTVIVP